MATGKGKMVSTTRRFLWLHQPDDGGNLMVFCTFRPSSARSPERWPKTRAISYESTRMNAGQDLSRGPQGSLIPFSACPANERRLCNRTPFSVCFPPSLD